MLRATVCASLREKPGSENTLPIIAIGGNTKDIGKTALVCAVIAAFPEFQWTAVKITGHDYGPTGFGPENCTVWEETKAGKETDTGRYLLAGARRALLVTRIGAQPPIQEIRKALADDRNIIFESNRIVDAVKPDVCLALIAGQPTERKSSFERLLSVADAVVTLDDSQIDDLPAGLPRFQLESAGKLSPQMISWLRGRLDAFSPQSQV
jgi:hypothetical protein